MILNALRYIRIGVSSQDLHAQYVAWGYVSFAPLRDKEKAIKRP